MAGVELATPETFERLCLTLDMARGLGRDDAYPLIRDAARALEPRSRLALWFLHEALGILGEDFVAPAE